MKKEQCNFRPLRGFRVLDATNEVGPLCGKILGDFGADVVKIEPPGGDPARNRGPFYKDIQDAEKSLSWWYTNLNKRSVTIDFETKDGKERFRNLIKNADFVIESFEPGYMTSLELGYDTLRQIKQDIVMTSITPFGQTGPYARYKATDITLTSLGGMVRLYGEPDRPPVRISEPQAYALGGIQGAVGSVLAHFHRRRTGKGQHVDVSCQQAVVLTLMYITETWNLLKVNYKRQGQRSFTARPEPLGDLLTQRVYPCKNGYIYSMVLGGAVSNIVASSKAMTRLANQHGYALELKDYDWSQLDMSKAPQEEINRVQDAMGKFFLRKAKEDLFEEAIKHSMLITPINNVAEIIRSPQLEARKFYVDIRHQELGETITYPGFPIKIKGFTYQPRRRPPLIGEHNDDIGIEGEHHQEEADGRRAPRFEMKIGENKAKQVLEGIKVADFAWVATGPQVGREFAEHGATVVRVESHKRPDPLRLLPPFKDGMPGLNRGYPGLVFNTNKLGISLDLSNPKGQEVARRLVQWADIVSDSMTPGRMKKFGLDYESCRKIKPDIIYYSTCQMGQHGPLSTFGGYGAFAVAYCGFSHITGWPDCPPTPLYNNYNDFIAPWYLIPAVVLALDHRRTTGEGLYMDQSQVEAGVTFMAPSILNYVVNGRIATRMGNRDAYMAPHGIYPCQGDDEWVAIAVRNEHEWQTFCKIIDRPDWADDSRFNTLAARQQNEDELDHLIGAWSRNYTPKAVMEMMQRAGISAGVAATAQDLLEDPQLKHRKHFRFLEHKVIGKVLHHAPAYILSETPCHIHKAGPCLGEDNEYVYKEILGYSDDEIADLVIEGVITKERSVSEVPNSRT